MSRANPPPADPRELASSIARTRTEFGRVYDEVRAAVGNTRPFNVVSAGAGSDQVAFERALRQADEEGWFTRLSERLILDGFFPDRSAPVTDLQALMSGALGFPDASMVEKGFLRATARLCKVEVTLGGNAGPVTGTGYLVGPSTVLTAFHVVAGLVGATGVPNPGSERRLRVHFDHATGRSVTPVYRVPEDWLAASSQTHPAEIATVRGSPELVAPPGGVDLQGFLDYAVVVVAASPGSERGYYDLEKAVEPHDGTIHLFQHPMGVQQRIATGKFAGFRDPPPHERVDHTANALVGSSGGLLLDGDYAVVGLHQGSHGQPVVNTGVSAIAIRDHVRAQGVDLLDATYVQAVRVADDSRPILGRTRCQEWVTRPSKRLVRVKPFTGIKGVSFTLEIMRACLPEGEHVIRCVHVLELDSDAMSTATVLLAKLGVDAAGLPTLADANTSGGAWIGDLVAAFFARVQEAHPDHEVWLVIDDFEKEHAIPDGSVRDFLSEMYKRSGTGLGNLRIVLLGLIDFPSGFPTGSADNEDISPPQLEDLVSYLRRRMTAGGIDHSSAEAQRLAQLIALSGGPGISSLSDFVADKVDRVLDDAITALS